jgi:hypothetical protein
MSSLDPGQAGTLGLEGAFHEAAHQWDEDVIALLNAEAKRQDTRVPNALWHAMIFYTAGDAVRREIPGHKTQAEDNDMWSRGPFAPFKDELDRAWLPWLDGKGTRDEAIAALIKLTGTR